MIKNQKLGKPNVRKALSVILMCLSANLYASFDACLDKSSKCEALGVPSVISEYKAKAVSNCDEVTFINASGVKEIAFYDCRVMLFGSGSDVSAIRIKVSPSRPK